jgi:hypothetical protein
VCSVIFIQEVFRLFFPAFSFEWFSLTLPSPAGRGRIFRQMVWKFRHELFYSGNALFPSNAGGAGDGPGFAGSGEAGHEDADEFLFAMAGGGFAGARVPFDARDAMEEANHAAREAFGIGDAIAGESLAQIAGLADVQNARAFTAHKINARAARERAEKFLTQPLYERRRRRKKPELAGHD